MLPRMRPRELYDLVIQVAIVRPGPIQGGMVHPYLRRRTGEEKVVYPSAALRDLLKRTLGVPLFQEQAMKLAMVGAGYSEADADRLRRDMAAFRRNGQIEENHRRKFIAGMIGNGYDPDFAERCFEQIKGFGDYGFPESHAQAFAWLAYVSSWLKCRHPAVFTCALLNSQPMGFYAPAQLIRDAQEHGVVVRRVDVAHSDWDCTLEEGGFVLRLGLSRLDGFRREWAEAMARERALAPYQSVEDLAHRAALPSAALRKLADADALGSLGHSRREALWEVRRKPPAQLPLFAYAGAPELGTEADAPLPQMPPAEEVIADYQTLRLSLKGHPMQFLRDAFRREGVQPCSLTQSMRDGRKIRMAGVVLTRQRPGKGNAVFITIEDETGIANGLLWARDLEKQRSAVMASRLMLIEGVIQRSEDKVVHVMVDRVIDRTAMLAGLTDTAPSQTPAPLHTHPRNVRILPKSRDFH